MFGASSNPNRTVISQIPRDPSRSKVEVVKFRRFWTSHFRSRQNGEDYFWYVEALILSFPTSYHNPKSGPFRAHQVPMKHEVTGYGSARVPITDLYRINAWAELVASQASVWRCIIYQKPKPLVASQASVWRCISYQKPKPLQNRYCASIQNQRGLPDRMPKWVWRRCGHCDNCNGNWTHLRIVGGQIAPAKLR